jgi:hypothetical protein
MMFIIGTGRVRAAVPPIAIERQPHGIGRRLGHRQADAQDCVGPQPALVRGAVQFDHDLVDGLLVGCVHPGKRLEDLAIRGLDRAQDTLAAIARLAVAQLHRLVSAGRGPGRHRRAALGTVLQKDIDLNGGIAPAVEYFAGIDVDYRAHGGFPCS